MKKAIYRYWFQEDGYVHHYFKIHNPDKIGSIAIGVSFMIKKVRCFDEVNIRCQETIIKTPKAYKTISKKKFEEMFLLANKKIAYLNRQSSL